MQEEGFSNEDLRRSLGIRWPLSDGDCSNGPARQTNQTRPIEGDDAEAAEAAPII